MHKGKFYPHIEAVDFRFPEPPWRVPPKLWTIQGVTKTGNYANDFPAQPWTIGLTADQRSGGFYRWYTHFGIVAGRLVGCDIEIALIQPNAWLGITLTIYSGAASSNTVVYQPITGASFSGVTFSALRSSTQPANLTLGSAGSANPKPW